MTLLEQLNAPYRYDRLKALKQLEELSAQNNDGYKNKAFVNNHIHTIYSFSPYSPTAAVYYAKKAGLITAGIMDHDTISGCKEFIEASKIANFPVTCGFEARVLADNTNLFGKRINNPDQKSIIYVAAHGIPHQNIDKCNTFLAPFRAKRDIRNKKMIENLNNILTPFDIKLKDVYSTENQDKGTITERHIMNEMAKALIEKFGKSIKIVDFLKDNFDILMPDKIKNYLENEDNEHYVYDLTGILKSRFLPKIYINATDECPTVFEFIDFTNSIGAISAYAYLGDVTLSVTGDKQPQKYEDDYLELLFTELVNLGFKAVTYMPSRNSKEQLKRIMYLCKKHNLLEISGEDINNSRQSFICKEILSPEYNHLVSSTFALIGHEYLSSVNQGDGMFAQKAIYLYKDLKKRIEHFEMEGNNLIYNKMIYPK
ncbi:MAG: PHP domain-containing protein [Clostridia bacterium]